MTHYLERIEFDEAETWEINCEFKEASGDPLDLTDCDRIEWVIGRADDTQALLVVYDQNDPPPPAGDAQIIVSDAPAGKAVIVVPPDKHPDILPGSYNHAARVFMPGSVSVQFSGPLDIVNSPFI